VGPAFLVSVPMRKLDIKERSNGEREGGFLWDLHDPLHASAKLRAVLCVDSYWQKDAIQLNIGTASTEKVENPGF
jgi:hypothetical protein